MRAPGIGNETLTAYRDRQGHTRVYRIACKAVEESVRLINKACDFIEAELGELIVPKAEYIECIPESKQWRKVTVEELMTPTPPRILVTPALDFEDRLYWPEQADELLINQPRGDN